MYLMPSISPMSWIRTTCLSVTWRASSSSRLNRRSRSCGHQRVGRDVRPDHLDRDRNLELLIPGLIDRSHATGAQQSDDVVARTEVLANHQRSALRAGRATARRGLGRDRRCRRPGCISWRSQPGDVRVFRRRQASQVGIRHTNRRRREHARRHFGLRHELAAAHRTVSGEGRCGGPALGTGHK